MNNERTPLNVLVLAVGGNVSQGILKALATSSLECCVIGTDISELQAGLYTVDRGYIAPHATAPGFVEWLVDLCRKERIEAILTGCEPILRVLARHKTDIEARTDAMCMVCDEAVWTLCDDKLRTCQWLAENQFAFPRYAAASDPEGVRRLSTDCGFPLIAKPRIGGGAHGVFLVNDAEDLAYASRKENYLVQEFLGTDEDEYTVGCFSDRAGVLCGTIVMWRELLAGTTYRAIAGVYPEVRREAERIVRALHSAGPCNLQFRMTPRGPVCFEINPRFSGTTPIRAVLGFNEVEATLRHFLLGESSVSMPDITKGVALRYWNEVYVTPEACATARKQGYIEAVKRADVNIERYGMD